MQSLHLKMFPSMRATWPHRSNRRYLAAAHFLGGDRRCQPCWNIDQHPLLGGSITNIGQTVIDTIRIKCRRRFKASVIEELKKHGIYQQGNWTITSKTTPDYNNKGGAKNGRKITYKDKVNKLEFFAEAGSETLETIRVELPRLLYPSNGCMLASNAEIQQAMAKLHNIVDEIAESGLRWTDTNRLDVVINLPVNPDEVMNIMRSARFPMVHRWPEIFEEERPDGSGKSDPQTLQWRGKEVWLSFYNKARLQRKKAVLPVMGCGCLRVELRLKGKQRIAKFLGATHGGAMVNFDFLTLYNSLRHVLCKLPPGKTIQEKCNFDNLLAACMAENFQPKGVPVTDWLRESLHPKTFKSKIKALTTRSLAMIGFDWVKLLPAGGPPELANVDQYGVVTSVFDPTWGPKRMRIVRNDAGYNLEEVVG